LIRTMAVSSHLPESQLNELRRYTACDIADTLLVLKVPNAGFIADLHLRANGKPQDAGNVTIALASTVLMVPKTGADLSSLPDVNVPSNQHWVDLTHPDTIVVMKQPEGQKCAVLGGIMALRMSVLQAKGVVVHGRVRDIEQLKDSGLLVST